MTMSCCETLRKNPKKPENNNHVQLEMSVTVAGAPVQVAWHHKVFYLDQNLRLGIRLKFRIDIRLKFRIDIRKKSFSPRVVRQ